MTGSATTAARFSPHVGTPFTVEVQSAPGVPHAVTLWLDAVEADRARADAVTAFSLIFSGSNGFLLQQGTYTMRHARLPELAIFLVPVERTATQHRYQACFNVVP